jgi:catechol 2,3-dioxygenase-like lactoylglutathione lyase family enzyme
MSLVIGSIVINTSDIPRAIAFWTEALGYVVRDPDHGDAFAVLCDPRRPWSNLSLQRTAERKQGRNRLHIDLYVDDQPAEVRRLEALGAVRIPWEYDADADHIVMADFDSNEFCVVQKSLPREG